MNKKCVLIIFQNGSPLYRLKHLYPVAYPDTQLIQGTAMVCGSKILYTGNWLGW